MLVHHADPLLDGVAGAAEADAFAAEIDLPVIRLIKAIENIHQRRLAGAVLSHNGMHFALFHLELHIVICLERSEILADIL